MCEHATEEILRLEDVTLRRGSFLLNQIRFSVRAGEIVAILGRTGAGKTLLLETIAGFCRPEAGRVLCRGTNICRIPLHQRNIGYLYQDFSLFPHMIAAANLGYGLKLRRVPKGEIQKRVETMADRFGIRSILDQYPGTLSGGEQQRVALARALMVRTPLLLLDEPFSALDPATKEGLYRLLREICQEFQCAVVLVTHDFREAAALSHRVGVLLGGTLRGVVPAQELFDAPWDEETRCFLGLEAPEKE